MIFNVLSSTDDDNMNTSFFTPSASMTLLYHFEVCHPICIAIHEYKFKLRIASF